MNKEGKFCAVSSFHPSSPLISSHGDELRLDSDGQLACRQKTLRRSDLPEALEGGERSKKDEEVEDTGRPSLPVLF